MRIESVKTEMPDRTSEESRQLQQQVKMRAMNSDLKLSDLSEEEKVHLSLDEQGAKRLQELRKAAYSERVKAMNVPQTIRDFAGMMKTAHGYAVKVWGQELPWLEALMVVRYGQEPSVWPTEFDNADTVRSMNWALLNQWPAAVERPTSTPPNERGFVKLGIVLALMFVAALAAIFYDARLWLGVPIFGSALTNFWENELIDHLFRARAYTAPANHYIALYTAAPGEAGGGTEVSGGSYARVQVAAGFANWLGTNGETTDVDSAGTGGQTSNRNSITWGAAPTAAWGLVTHMASLDAATAGNMYFFAALTQQKTINNGDPAPSFAAAALTFTLA